VPEAQACITVLQEASGVVAGDLFWMQARLAAITTAGSRVSYERPGAV
jgi:hypothetical protein